MVLKKIIYLCQNVNAYNYNGKTLSDIIYALDKKRILKELGTLHPKDMTEDLIEAHGVVKN